MEKFSPLPEGIKGEPFTGYENPDGKGPFQCGNCHYYRPSNSTCGQETMVAKSHQPLVDGRRRVELAGCCEFVERIGSNPSDRKRWMVKGKGVSR